MNNRHLRSGIFFISIGIIFLLVNFNILDGYSILRTVLEYWPAIFIVIGINIIFRKYDFVRIATWLLFLGAIIFLSYNNSSYGYKSGQWINSSSNVSIEKNISTERGELNIGFGGTKLVIDSTEANLVDAYISNSNIVHREDYSNDNKNATVDFRNDRGIIVWPGVNENRIGVNNSVIWDMNIDTGAADAVVDMSDLKVEDLEIKTGAASFRIIFGNKYKLTNASIKAGVSSFDIIVPKDSGVRVNLSGALVGNNLDNLGWEKENNNNYISPNYDSAMNKIDLDIDMGLGSFDIKTQ